MKKQVVFANCRQCSAVSASVFVALNEENIHRITDSKTCSVYAKGQIVFGESAYPLGIFCIKQGSVKEYRTSQTGHEQIIRISKKGDIIGYEALLTNNRYETTAEALEDVVLCFVPSSTFNDVLAAEGNLCSSMMKMMAFELQYMKEKVAELALKNVRERLAHTLLELRKTYGTEEDDLILDIPLTRESLAQIVGAAPENIIRLLSEFKREKLITISYHYIQLINVPALNLLAEGQYTDI